MSHEKVLIMYAKTVYGLWVKARTSFFKPFIEKLDVTVFFIYYCCDGF